MKNIELKIASMIPTTYFYIFIKVLIAVFIFIGFYTIIKYFIGQDIIKNAAKKKVNEMHEDQKSRNKQYAKESYHFQEDKKNIFYRIDKRFQYSGLQKKIPYLSSGLYLIISITASCLVGIIAMGISQKILVSIAALVITGALFYAVEGILSFKNYKSVEEDLSEFLSEVKAYSASTDDILSCFRAISENMHEPLKSALYEFYIQAQSTGDKSKSFYDLMNKIEHPMFKQFIRNLEICTRHSADYGVIVDNCRKTLRNFLKSKRDIQAQNKADMITMFILIIAGIFGITVMRAFTEIDIWRNLFHTTLGNVFLLYEISVLAIFMWNILFTNKN